MRQQARLARPRTGSGSAQGYLSGTFSRWPFLQGTGRPPHTLLCAGRRRGLSQRRDPWARSPRLPPVNAWLACCWHTARFHVPPDPSTDRGFPGGISRGGCPLLSWQPFLHTWPPFQTQTHPHPDSQGIGSQPACPERDRGQPAPAQCYVLGASNSIQV